MTRAWVGSRAVVTPEGNGWFQAWCQFCEDGLLTGDQDNAQAWADRHNTTEHAVCDVCGVDHATTMADLSHGIIRLILHAQERMTWMEYPVNGDMLARQRAGIVGRSLLYSTTDPQEIDWDRVLEQAQGTGE